MSFATSYLSLEMPDSSSDSGVSEGDAQEQDPITAMDAARRKVRAVLEQIRRIKLLFQKRKALQRVSVFFPEHARYTSRRIADVTCFNIF